MRIRWKSIYWPYGEWKQEDGTTVPNMPANFRAVYNDRVIIVTSVNQTSPPGHGEGSVTSAVPFYIYEDTMESFDPRDKPWGDYHFIDVPIPGEPWCQNAKREFHQKLTQKIGGFNPDDVSGYKPGDAMIMGINMAMEAAWDLHFERMLTVFDAHRESAIKETLKVKRVDT
jgi:hypothetical protein